MGFHDSELLSILARLSFTLLLALLPSLLYNAFDTLGWQHLLSFPRNMTFFQALRIHISSEVVTKTIPLGAPIADSIKVMLLKREHNIAISEGLSSVVYRRMYLGLTQGMYLIVGGVIAFPLLQNRVAIGITSGFVGWIPIGSGFLLALALLLGFILLSSFRVRLGAVRVCMRIPSTTIRERLVHVIEGSGGTTADAGNKSHALFSKSGGVAFIWFFVYWCMEALETLVFMKLLGMPATFQQVVAIEAVVSALRSAAFFLPSGIGIQDIGYAAMMASVGCVSTPGDASGFVLVKRVKDISWASLGYMFLVTKGLRPFRKSILAQAN